MLQLINKLMAGIQYLFYFILSVADRPNWVKKALRTLDWVLGFTAVAKWVLVTFYPLETHT